MKLHSVDVFLTDSRHSYGYQLYTSSQVYFFLYSYEAYFIHGLLKSNENKLALSFDLTFHNIDDINNSKYLHMEYTSFRTRDCRSYNDFLDRRILLINKKATEPRVLSG